MIVIDKESEGRLLSLSDDIVDLHTACRILENAVIKQFLQINVGLLSGKLVDGELTQTDVSSLKRCLLYLFPEETNTIQNDAKQFILDGIWEKKWPIVHLQDLLEIKICIIGKYVPFWEWEEINEQLSILLSDYRVFFAGTLDLVALQIRNMYHFSPTPVNIDARFIVGKVGALTISQGGPVFDFIEEIVTSPFLDNHPGFSIGDTAVIRRKIISSTCTEQSFDDSVAGVYYHEIIHTISHSLKEGAPYSSANWDTVVKRDVCRFLKKPAKYEEIIKVFDIISKPQIFIRDLALKFAPESAPGLLNAFTEINDIIDSLIKEGIIIKQSNYYFCSLWEDNHQWDLA